MGILIFVMPFSSSFSCACPFSSVYLVILLVPSLTRMFLLLVPLTVPQWLFAFLTIQVVTLPANDLSLFFFVAIFCLFVIIVSFLALSSASLLIDTGSRIIDLLRREHHGHGRFVRLFWWRVCSSIFNGHMLIFWVAVVGEIAELARRQQHCF